MSLFTRLFGEPVATISAKEVETKLKVGRRPFLLDVRQPDEFRHGHISGAKLIPLGELSRRMQEVPKGREIVCICATGHRSVPAVRKLVAAGYKATSLKNGMIAWKAAHLPINQ